MTWRGAGPGGAPRILVDVDSTIADLLTPWLARVKERFGGDLRVEDLQTWDTHLYHPAGYQVYEVLEEPGLYRDLKPLPGALEALARFRDTGWQVVLGTASQHDANLVEKSAWIRHHLPWLPKRQVMLGHGKELVRADVFADDGPHNARAYRQEHPHAFITTITYPYNVACQAYDYHSHRWTDPALAWPDIFEESQRYYDRMKRS